MARSVPRSRSQTQTVAIRRILLVDALTSWVVPTVAVAAIVLAVLLNALGVLGDAVSAAISVAALLVIAAYMIMAPFFDAASDHPAVPWPALVGGALVWLAVFYAPFHARLFVGAPLAQLHVDPAQHDVVIPVAGHGSMLDLVVEAHLPIASEQRDRSVIYDLDVADDAGAQAHYSGELGERWRMRRLGRRGTAPTRIDHLSTAHLVTDPGATNLRLERATVSGEPAATLSATFYPHRLPSPVVLYTVAGLLASGALAFDWWAHPRDTPLAALLTATAAAAALVFTGSTAGHPGIRDVIGAVVVGGVVGVPLAFVAAWILQRVTPRRAQSKARRRA